MKEIKHFGNIKYLIAKLLELDSTKEYLIEIKDPKDKRTLRQNRHMWALISQIAKKQHQEDMEIYCQVLEEANAKYEYVLGLESIEDELRKNFRAVKVARPEYYKGKKMLVYKCFVGSSKMNKKEMAELLEIVKRWATELNIPTLDDMMFM